MVSRTRRWLLVGCLAIAAGGLEASGRAIALQVAAPAGLVSTRALTDADYARAEPPKEYELKSGR